MNPIIHLYGMRIKLSGDLDRARERVHLANQLRFKTQMVNVNNLDIVQNFAKLDDGTTVRYVGQHGLDWAEIYVPPKPMVQVPRKRKRIEVLYHPAFEVSFGQGEPVAGWVIARGEGWQGPYEFIAKPDNCKVDIFNYGSWWRWYETMPFDMDEFLKPKLISTIRKSPTVTAEYTEIPPHGTKNRIFVSGRHAPIDEIDRECYYTSEYFWDCQPSEYFGSDWLDYHLFLWGTYQQNTIWEESLCFTIGDDGDSEEPEYWNYSLHYKPKDHILSILDGYYLDKSDKFRKFAWNYLLGLAAANAHSCAELEADIVADIDPFPPIEFDCDKRKEFEYCSEFKYELLIQYKDYAINYEDWFSNAENESHYFLGYLLKNYHQSEIQEKHPMTADDWWDFLAVAPIGAGCEIAYADTNEETIRQTYSFYVAISNEVIPIKKLDDIDSWVFEARYFRVGESLEFGLMNVHAEETDEYHYVYTEKTPNGTNVEHSVVIPGEWGEGHPIPFIKGPDNQNLYSNDCGIRLIRETVTYEEEL